MYNGNQAEDILAMRPEMVILWAGYGFSKSYLSPRGHMYAIEDLYHSLRTGAPRKANEGPQPASCWACKSLDVPRLIDEVGSDGFYKKKWYDWGSEVVNPVGCGDCHDPESMDFYCDVIIDEANKMNNMVKRLLTLNQIEFGEAELVMERFDINELVKSVAAANELRASQKELTIQTFMSEEPLYVWADEYKVEEVITNYISNAINHCCNENIIKVNVEQIDKDNVRVTVYNSGKNIPEEDIEHI